MDFIRNLTAQILWVGKYSDLDSATESYIVLELAVSEYQCYFEPQARSLVVLVAVESFPRGAHNEQSHYQMAS